jgi:hypothetical protein
MDAQVPARSATDLLSYAWPGVEHEPLLDPETIRACLRRLSSTVDERSTALSLLLLLRCVAIDLGEGTLIELSAEDLGVLVTIEDAHRALWFAEVIPTTIEDVREALQKMPVAFERFELREDGPTTTLHLRATPPMPSITTTSTEREMPSLDLLLQAGLLPGNCA